LRLGIGRQVILTLIPKHHHIVVMALTKLSGLGHFSRVIMERNIEQYFTFCGHSAMQQLTSASYAINQDTITH